MSECNHIISVITSQHCHGNYYHCTIGTVTANHTTKAQSHSERHFLGVSRLASGLQKRQGNNKLLLNSIA